MKQKDQSRPDSEIERSMKPRSIPPAGPHDKEELIDRDKTPGTGALADKNQPDVDVGPD